MHKINIERTVCELVRHHWGDINPDSQAPESLLFLKVAGKTSPNASIIALVLDECYRRAVAVAKIPRNPQLTIGLEREYAAMLDLRESVRNAGTLAHLPYNGTMAEINGINILLQTAGSGWPMVREMTSRKSIEMLYEVILPWVFNFHAEGAEQCVLEGETLREFVESPIARFMDQVGAYYTDLISRQTRQYLLELPCKVEGLKVPLCRQHGDFNAHNVLVKLDFNQLVDFTLIDLEDYQFRQLPIYDLNHFFTSNSKVVGGGMTAQNSYSEFLLKDGWYQDLFKKAVTSYEERELIEEGTFWMLSPLYFIGMCNRVLEVQRQQEDTVVTWLTRMNAFIKRYCRS